MSWQLFVNELFFIDVEVHVFVSKAYEDIISIELLRFTPNYDFVNVLHTTILRIITQTIFYEIKIELNFCYFLNTTIEYLVNADPISTVQLSSNYSLVCKCSRNTLNYKS